MTEDQQLLDDKRRFVTDLRQVIEISGLTRRELASSLGMRRSTLSDILLGKQRTLPKPAFLADLLAACGKGDEEIERWMGRRADIIRRDPGSAEPAGEEEIDRLAAKLDEAAVQLADLQNTARHLRDKLKETIIARNEINAQLVAERLRGDQSQQTIAGLEAKAVAAGRYIERLKHRLSDTVERLRTADRLVIDLRADLMSAENDFADEEYRRLQSFDPSLRIGRVADQQVAYPFDGPAGQGPSIRDLRIDLDAQKDVITEARTMCLGALQMLSIASGNLTNILHGAAAIIAREELPQHMTAACEELAHSLRCMNEFAHRSYDLRVAAEGEIAGIALRVEHCGYGVTECLETLGACRDTLAALVADDRAGELSVIVEVASNGLDNCLGAIASATRAIDDYSAAL